MGDDFVGKELGGSYRIIRRMAEGGMGAIYEAEHLRVSKKVVVKVLQRDVLVNKEAYHRFVREAEVTSAIGHPNIVEVLDFNYTEDGIPFLVLEYLDGEDLATILERRGQLGPEQVVLFAREVGSALKAAHDKGIVHRDLKPHNIFLCRFGERDDFPKILDFGISKIKGSDSFLTQSQSYLGSAHYMAPEQARGRSAESDERTDVFALGAILYRMLTGQEAFEGDSLPSILYNIVHTHPDPVSAVNPAVPGPVSDAIQRAMAKAPGDRFQSIAQMVDTLVAAAGPLADRAALPSHLAPAPLASPPGPGEAAALPEEATAPTVLEKPPGPAAPPRSVPSVSLSGEIGSATEGELEHLRRISKRWRPVALGAAALVLGGVVTLLVLRAGREPETPREPPVAPPAATSVQRKSPPPAPAPAPDAAAPARSPVRRLWVTSEPAAAEVRVGSERLGPTPLEGAEIPAAAGTLSIAKPGFVTWRKALAAGADEVRLGRVRLDRLPVKPPPRAVPPAKARPRGTGRGTVSVATVCEGKPLWADAYLDGEKIGQTPLLIREVTPGRHEVTARREGYKTAAKLVNVLPDKKVYVVITLTK